MQTIRIQTAQNVFIEYLPASVGDRILATLIDGVVIWSYLIIVVGILATMQIDGAWLYIILLGIPYLFYDLVSEIVMDGQTIGKKAMNIKVVKLDGTQPSIASYLLRWLIRWVDMLFSGAVAILAISVNGKGQRLGDMAAGTSVISLKRRVGLNETILPNIQENYQPVYPQVTSLSDRDVAIIKEALYVHNQSEQPDPRLIETLATKVKNVLQVESSMPPMAFLHTILRDHAYLTSQ
ncbi:RDD family protein [Rhodocytophaga rosea]|uniref:RDD family protein n=1 Tax=Rhodocytophaga rosea TaxID=2704465 RepID=A0A6C0GPA3_9BACT|nr:RDD family protein [Rhodocytophaga rosea]QHT69875.1 RDD family protein [Rhodocytophaga rosea]